MTRTFEAKSQSSVVHRAGAIWLGEPFMNSEANPNGAALAVFAHELRQPLASILLAVRSIYEGAEDHCANREMCNVVERQAQILAQMIEEVLDVSSCRLGKLRLIKSCFDLAAAISIAVETTAPLFALRNHQLTISLPQESVYLIADPLRIQQVISNLLANAAKYTGSGGSIRLVVEVESDFVAIEIRDNGTGIPAEALPRLFDLFDQGSASEYQACGGLGVGLALVKSLVDLHGGSVSARSDGVGLGSAFVVRLPVLDRGLYPILSEAKFQPRAGAHPICIEEHLKKGVDC